MDTISILLSTYNGEKYLEQQIESIIKQSYKNWKLVVRDDGSTDQTVKIIEKYVKIDKRISFNNINYDNMGVVKSFLFLLNHVKSDYYMFCDQDDIWLKDKVKLTLSCIKEKELKEMKPYLIHTDLKVVDQNLNNISNSIYDYQKLPKESNYISSFIQNNVVGCTVLFNNHLKELVKYQDGIVMHDWWLALVARTFGEVVFLPTATILYRQHGKNAVGTTNFRLRSSLRSSLSYITMFIKNRKTQKFDRYFIQVEVFSDCYEKILMQNQKKILDELLNIKKSNRINTIKILQKSKFKGNSNNHIDNFNLNMQLILSE